ncbi:MAG: M48 family metalloprotease [Candidatus Eremiobacteraeota bacterium]|nr:M48 family metalloprotease [Candidatus Eremiobacteraeota bacterium]
MRSRLTLPAFYGVAVASLLFLAGFAPAVAAIQRPNVLDRHVTAISDRALMQRPAIVLVDRERQAAASRKVHWTAIGWIVAPVFEAIALFYLWSSGGAASLRNWLARRLRSRWSIRFCYGAALALLARLAALLPAFYLYRVDRTLQLTPMLTRTWGLFWLFHTLLAMIVAGIIAAVVLWLVDRTHQWYAYTVLAILAVSVGWGFASPYVQAPFGRTRALHGGLVDNLDSLLARAGIAPMDVVESSRDSPIGEVTVLPAWPERRIIVGRTVVAADTPLEIAYRVAYEVGGIAHDDALSVALIEGGTIIIFAALATGIADRIRFRRDDDPLSRLAIVGALFALVYLVAVPVRNAALRPYVFDADRYAVALTQRPAAAVRALVREADQRMEEVCPESSALLFLSTSPGIGARVAAINHVPSRCP